MLTVPNLFIIYLCHSIAYCAISESKYSDKTSICIWGATFLISVVFGMSASAVFSEAALKILFFGTFLLYMAVYLLTTAGTVGRNIFIGIGYCMVFMMILIVIILLQLWYDIFPWGMVSYMSIYGVGLYFYTKRYKKKLLSMCARVESGWAFINLIAVTMFVLFANSSIGFMLGNTMDISALVNICCLFVLNGMIVTGLFHTVGFMSQKARAREIILRTQLLQVQIEQLEEIKLTYQRYRHDERHHNLLITEFAKNGQIEQLLEYVGDLEEDQERWHFEKLCNDDTVNSVLVIYKRKSEKQNIAFQSFAVLPAESQFATIDLAAIISNMLENAYHASMTCESSFITFHMYEKYGKLVIECKNSCDKNVEFHNGMPKAADGHGMGINSMIGYAKKYNGDIQFSEEKMVFQVKIVMNI